eukprot:CAMPEP_0184489674 /NCGR_PEP_ID=MMETSP0113_2-20130426/16097_1 /TAXON_ID=91329 /ORGANISM="Norrisiella sphaerica, Strain BC52" /LENGTH=188 /DNA_ID=CAMNT_0026873235 /DNA_START=352 /DNA_END=915 /DNA_ORIENTATION=+
MRMSIENALDYSEKGTVIVVHINHPHFQGSPEEDVDWQWIVRTNATSDQVFINPESISIRAWTGKILEGMLLNFAYAKKICPKFSHMIIMNGDQVVTRRGMEAWVRKHHISFSGLNYHPDAITNSTMENWRADLREQIRDGTEFPMNTRHSFRFSNASARLGWNLKENWYYNEGTFYPREILESFEKW